MLRSTYCFILYQPSRLCTQKVIGQIDVLLHTKGPSHKKCLIRPSGTCLEFGNDTLVTIFCLCLLLSMLQGYLYVVLGWDDFSEKEDAENTEVSSESLEDVASSDLSV